MEFEDFIVQAHKISSDGILDGVRLFVYNVVRN